MLVFNIAQALCVYTCTCMYTLYLCIVCIHHVCMYVYWMYTSKYALCMHVCILYVYIICMYCMYTCIHVYAQMMHNQWRGICMQDKLFVNMWHVANHVHVHNTSLV